MGTYKNYKNFEATSLQNKMKKIFRSILDIEKSNNEEEACLLALYSLESLNYKFAMISFLKEINGKFYIIADPKFSIGKKWVDVASLTKPRDFENPFDILPLVLIRKESKFIVDSRIDIECEEELCKQLNVISQYVIPLFTDSLLIGTLQIDLGTLTEIPEEECIMLDALATHLSVSVERFRTLLQLNQAQNDLMSKSKLIAYEAATAKIMHSLSHEIKDYVSELNKTINDEKIRCNKEALEFLLNTKKSVGKWFKVVEDNALTLKKNEEPVILDVYPVIKEVVSYWYNVANSYKCKIEIINQTENVKIYARLGSINELLSCLILNSIEANARKIVIELKYRKNEINNLLEITHLDDGDGIPETAKENIFKLGWTSKIKRGHGIGMTIITLLVKEMAGHFEIISFGKSSQEENTKMQILIPIKEIDYGM